MKFFRAPVGFDDKDILRTPPDGVKQRALPSSGADRGGVTEQIAVWHRVPIQRGVEGMHGRASLNRPGFSGGPNA